ncbi:unnamed protein product, partial [Didymodactylos carnosus]
EAKQSNALNLVNVAGIFYILIGGLALAIIIAVLEFFVKANVEAKQTKSDFCDVMKRNMRLSITGMDLEERSTDLQQNCYFYKLPEQDNYQSYDALFDEYGNPGNHVNGNQSQV